MIVLATPKAKIAVQICYDVEFPEATRYLADQGDAIVRPDGLRHGYRLAPDGERSVPPIAERMIERFESREVGEIERLHLVETLCETPQCIPQQLIAYFGEMMEPCGTCGVCLGKSAGGPLPAAKRESITIEQAEVIRTTKAQNHPRGVVLSRL